ncbi:MAG: transcription termination/antitermination protein NusG [Desulfobulbaceae bacterium]|nr:transcription termination/antitermination protein NusG [Desulfobulbaceae bacterium]
MALRWYIVNTFSGFEERAKASLIERIKNAHQEELFGDILIPTEQVIEMVKGAKKTSARKFFPGYILVNVDLNDQTWHTVTGTPKISGFIGNEIHPDPLSDEEANKIINRIKDGALKPKPKVSYEIGDPVRVTDGPFSSFQGTVDQVYPDKGRVRVMVSIFGRETPVELEYIQVTKG